MVWVGQQSLPIELQFMLAKGVLYAGRATPSPQVAYFILTTVLLSSQLWILPASICWWREVISRVGYGCEMFVMFLADTAMLVCRADLASTPSVLGLG